MKRRKARSVSTRLVMGYLERISSGVFDRYSKLITGLVGGKHGIYALYRNNTLYYVGLATDLRKRLNHHLVDRHKGKWNYFSLYFVRKERLLKEMESLTIRIAYPKGNKSRGKFGTAPDLRKALKSRMKAEIVGEIGTLLGGTAPHGGSSKGKSAKMIKAGKMAAETRRKTGAQIPLRGLLGQAPIRGNSKGKSHAAWVYPSGRIRVRGLGKMFDSPSGAAKAVSGNSVDGWLFWRYRNSKGEWVPLHELRKAPRSG